MQITNNVYGKGFTSMKYLNTKIYPMKYFNTRQKFLDLQYTFVFSLQVKFGRGHARAYDYRQSVQMRNRADHLVDAQDTLDNRKVRCNSSVAIFVSFTLLLCK